MYLNYIIASQNFSYNNVLLQLSMLKYNVILGDPAIYLYYNARGQRLVAW